MKRQAMKNESSRKKGNFRAIGNSTWDNRVDYEKMKQVLAEKIKYELYQKYKNRSRLPNGIIYLAVYAIQLRNGSRISEALEAWQRFRAGEYEVMDGKMVTEVRVRKKVKTSKTVDEETGQVTVVKIGREVTRSMVFPEFVPRTILKKDFPNEHKVTLKSLKACARKKIGCNTHSLRYSFITHATTKGISSLHVANMIKHSSPKILMKYVQRRKSDEILVNLE